MGFLGGLVNNMLRESTGYDMRKIKRMVGGKNVLMLGAGAALAGGVAAALGSQQQQGQAGGRQSWDATPRGPMPAPVPTPVPTAPGPPATPSGPPSSLPGPPVASAQPPQASPPSAVPPLPPIPGAAVPTPVAQEAVDDELEIPQHLTYGIVRAMVAAALSDGHLDEREKQVVLDRLDDSGLDDEQKQQVHRDLAIPPTPGELAALSEESEQRQAMYRFAGLLILADGSVSDLERSWLDRLAKAFGFDEAQKAALEAEIFE